MSGPEDVRASAETLSSSESHPTANKPDTAPEAPHIALLEQELFRLEDEWAGRSQPTPTKRRQITLRSAPSVPGIGPVFVGFSLLLLAILGLIALINLAERKVFEGTNLTVFLAGVLLLAAFAGYGMWEARKESAFDTASKRYHQRREELIRQLEQARQSEGTGKLLTVTVAESVPLPQKKVSKP